MRQGNIELVIFIINVKRFINKDPYSKNVVAAFHRSCTNCTDQNIPMLVLLNKKDKLGISDQEILNSDFSLLRIYDKLQIQLIDDKLSAVPSKTAFFYTSCRQDSYEWVADPPAPPFRGPVCHILFYLVSF